ncbi:hypothetical protein PCC8801_1291 [Rippkaea orientalis PCC 8801]|uniref:Uncharacterized protein n=1 Tax=Rippkaea orientalis (strain PCC 8801 / RF-1) TaxID=41431 RepID=B7K3L4_RIPO1|nr:hypothetical protein [Rippkaea orientalis]ACK65356.1 hypothetical protein PCC8801_1291 [Rippkaea orientalis PCC 8801]
MTTAQKVTKEQLLKAIKKLENDDNLGGFLTEIGLGAIGAGAAGAAAATLGTTTALFGLITVATPVGLVVGAGVLGATALVGAKRILEGTYSEGKKAELLRQLQDKLREVEAKEKASRGLSRNCGDKLNLSFLKSSLCKNIRNIFSANLSKIPWFPLQLQESPSSVTEQDKRKLIILLKEPIQYNLISPEKAQQLIDAVTNGKLPITEAYKLVQDLIKSSS